MHMHLTMFAFEHHSKIITQHKFASECHNIATTVIAQSPLKLSIDGQCNRKKVTQHIQPAQFFPTNAAMAEEKNVINHFSSLFCHIHVDSCFFMCVVSLEMKMFDVCLYFTAIYSFSNHYSMPIIHKCEWESRNNIDISQCP